MKPKHKPPEKNLLRERRNYEKQNRECAEIIVANPELVNNCVLALDWALNFVEIPLEPDP
jgi:hypothetical protein